MNKKVFLFLIGCAFFLSAFTGYRSEDPKHSFIGVKKCGMCHKKDDDGAQLKIWEASAHAKAYKTLLTEESDKIAKEKGFETKAVETDFCLKCHVTGHGAEANLLLKGFNIEDGVQCEYCHGAGNDYKSLKVMKDRAASIANGMRAYENTADIEAMCKECHNEESPTYKPFDFPTRWEEIKHFIPGKEQG